MNDFMHGLGGTVAILGWIAGTVLAPGWWKVAAFFFPPYPWYLVVERAMQMAGALP